MQSRRTDLRATGGSTVPSHAKRTAWAAELREIQFPDISVSLSPATTRLEDQSAYSDVWWSKMPCFTREPSQSPWRGHPICWLGVITSLAKLGQSERVISHICLWLNIQFVLRNCNLRNFRQDLWRDDGKVPKAESDELPWWNGGKAGGVIAP